MENPTTARLVNDTIENVMSVSRAVPYHQKEKPYPPAPTLRPIDGKQLVDLCTAARETFMSQPMLLELGAPVVICGDIHGQLHDLLRIFVRTGHPDSTNYLFLGDYVDRGNYSIETIALLFAFKIKYPTRFFLLRGNHECASITHMYGFYDDCKRLYNVKLWKTFCDVFNCMPVAAIVAQRIFCCHGGISQSLDSMDQIRFLERPSEIPDVGLMCDLLWADPARRPETGHYDENGWRVSSRGVSYTFGKDVLSQFLTKHDLDVLVRAHEVVEDGYEFYNERKMVTVFSAPNYCEETDNAGAVMRVDEDLVVAFEILKPLLKT